MLLQNKSIFNRSPFFSIFFLLFLGVITIIGSGCADNPNPETEIIPEIIPIEAPPAPGDADLAELETGIRAFTLEFYQTFRKESGNLLYSPYSVSVALAITWAGARGETAAQMADALHFTLPDTRLHTTFNVLDLMFETRGWGYDIRLDVKNSVWAQKDFPVLPYFLDIQAEHYGAGLSLLDFIDVQDPSRIVINDWVSDQSQEGIKDLLPPWSITGDTRLVLTNAIYFNARWSDPFETSLTAREPFYQLSGDSTMTSMMTQTGDYPYTERENYQAVELLYDGNELSMVVLLPAKGEFEAFENGLDQSGLEAILAALQTTNVSLKMPRFNYESESISLKNALTEMGMPIVFTGAADFSGIGGGWDLLISDVFCKGLISVDEEGSETATATAATIATDTAVNDVAEAKAMNDLLTADHSDATEMKINRPFLFFIRDINTGTILFLGRIVQTE